MIYVFTKISLIWIENEKASFTPIDRNTWPRAQQFYCYTEVSPTIYNVTVSLNATILQKH